VELAQAAARWVMPCGNQSASRNAVNVKPTHIFVRDTFGHDKMNKGLDDKVPVEGVASVDQA
jgi:hypothetical protein